MKRAPRLCEWENCAEASPPYGFALPIGNDIEYVQVCPYHRLEMAARSAAALAATRGAPSPAAPMPPASAPDETERRPLPPPLPDAGGQGRLL